MAGLALSACGGAGPEGQALPETSPGPTAIATTSATPVTEAASPSNSPTRASAESPPTLPDLAKEKSPVGLRAFALHYVDVYNYALRTGQTDLLEALVTSACDTCAEQLKQIRQVYDAGGRIEGGVVEVLNSAAPKLGEGLDPIVDIKIRVARQKTFDADGDVVKTYASEDGTLMFLYPKWRAERWILDELKLGVVK